MSQPTRQRGFSLMELMIAIMILGIGTVMVATVFPIGIDIARQAIQANLAPAVLQSAATALKVKVPAYREFDGVTSNQPATATHRVLVPDTYKIELDTDNPPLCNITQDENEALVNLKAFVASPPPPPGAPVSYSLWGKPLGSEEVWPGLESFLSTLPSGQDVPTFVSRTRVFTERTGWANEYNTANPAHEAYLVPAQNLPFLNLSDLVGMPLDEFINDVLPTMPCPTFRVGPLDPDLATNSDRYLPRISFVDQVYPPVALTYSDPDSGQIFARPTRDVAAELVSRRYSWIAFHHKMSSSSSEQPDMLATIVVFHRADLAERYARQADLDTDTAGYQAAYDLTDDTDQEALLQPQPEPPLPNGDPPPSDTLFPQPWLVALGRVNPATGEIGCTPEVARLLPAGSFFVVARSVDGMPAGRYFEVLESSWDRDNLYADPRDETAWATLTIPRGTGQATDGVVVWVFPPAIERVPGSFSFSRRSPIAGVGMEVLTFTDD